MSMRKENAGENAPLGKPDKITIHWTAGNYSNTYDSYHFNVKGDGTVVQTLSTQFKGSHTWQRNANNIGVTMCCMADGFPPTKKQIEATARLVAELMGIYGISIENVKDHAYYARLDGYSNLRWDVGKLIEPILDKARWYRIKLINGVIQNEMKDKVF